MTYIEVAYEPSEWRGVWLFPSRPNSLFQYIQVWEWVRQHNEDDFLDLESYADMMECREVDEYQQREENCG